MGMTKLISPVREARLREQGYQNQSVTELSQIAFGIRFAYRLCNFFLIIGVVTQNLWVLGAMATVAFSSIMLPYHPFDYIYNHLLSKPMNRPLIPPRSKQLKFACGLATSFILITMYLFAAGHTLAGYLVGGQLILVAALVGTIDLCIPSIIYNYFFGKRTLKETP
jgi:hypothetical protein